MGLFERKKPVIENTFLNVPKEAETGDAVNYNSVLDYMLTLTDEDYEKLLKVAKVYRDANKKAAEIIGAEGVAIETMGEPLKSEVDIIADTDDEEALDNFLNEELTAAFIEDNGETGKKGKKDVSTN